MAYTRHYYPKLNFVLTRGSGVVDDHALMIHLMSFQAESKKFPLIRELVDLRPHLNASKLTVLGLIRIAETHKDLFPDRDFLAAILVDSASMGKIAEVYSLLVRTLNLKVKVFQGNLAEPLSWLGYQDTDINKLKRFIGRHARSDVNAHPR